jgi:ferredoxin
MSRPAWFVPLVKTLFPARYTLARLTRFRLVGWLVEWLFFHGDQVLYLPRDGTLLPPAADSRVVSVHQSIPPAESTLLPSLVVEHFIQTATYLFIMEHCLCREAGDCHDYPHDLGCLFLGEAVLEINPSLGHMVNRDEALAHVRRAHQAGLFHLIGRNRMDALFLGAGPNTRLMTICNCCPCCCAFKMAPQLSPEINAHISRMPGLEVHIGEECVGCGVCSQEVCFVNAIHLGEDGRAHINNRHCRGCGRCAEVCPQDAIHLHLLEGRGAEEVIHQLSGLVDVS